MERLGGGPKGPVIGAMGSKKALQIQFLLVEILPGVMLVSHFQDVCSSLGELLEVTCKEFLLNFLSELYAKNPY